MSRIQIDCSKVKFQVKWTLAFGLQGLAFLFLNISLPCRHDILGVEVLELVVFGHEAGQLLGEVLDLRGELDLTHKALCVLLKFLWFDLLVSIQLVNA